MSLWHGEALSTTSLAPFVSMRGKRMETPKLEQFKVLAEDYSLIRLNGKKPIEPGWQQYSQMKRTFEEICFNVGENAGIACGPASCLLVLDVDDEELFQQAQQKNNWSIPDTRTIRTGSGGTHYCFRYPQDENQYGNRAFKSYGFDIRGIGGQVVAPGSVHPDSGKLYQVENDVPTADPPGWLLELAMRKARGTTSRKTWDQSFDPIELEPVNLDTLDLTPHIKNLIEEAQPKGKRSDAIWAVLNALVSAGINDGQIISIFEQYPIGEKYLDMGESRQAWLLPQISKAREKSSPDALPEIEYAALPMKENGTIPPEVFVQQMEHRWTQALGNVASEPLRQTWRQLAEAFNHNISSHFNPDLSDKWWVLQPSTGTGKTQGAIVYCSMLAELPDWLNPGAVIVTRLIEDADAIATQINELAGREIAIAHHSKSNSRLMGLGTWPVLVITHRAYEMALDFLGQEEVIQQTWPFLHEWNGGHRKLVIIDECLDLVEHSQVDLDRIRQALAAIPQDVRKDFTVEITAITEMIDIMEQMGSMSQGKSCYETLVLKKAVTIGTPPDFTGLRQALRNIRFDHQIGKEDLQENERLRKRYDEVLRSLHTVYRSWLFYSKLEAKHTLNTARLMVPEDVKGAVVLDATASSNVIYQLFEQAKLLQPSMGVRNYRNVTLHASKGHTVGKVYMLSHGKVLAEQLIGELNQKIPGSDALIICQKHVEPSLQGFDTTFTMKSGHWGKVDGSNLWKDCDTVVIFGLPFRPDIWTANSFMAYQGPQETEWLRADGDRPFAGHQDIRHALKVGQLVTDVIQAINRVRCRKVIDGNGNCPVTQVYMLLPANSMADELLAGIKQEMPGINITDDWRFDSQKAKARKSNHELALMKYLENMPIGKQAKKHVKTALGIPDTTMDKLIGKVHREPESDLAKLMAMEGVKLESTREGRSPKTYFVKG
jgi:hypothetical protein